MPAAPSIRPCEIDVTLGGVVYTVPALPAADWLVAVISEEPGSVLPGLLPLEEQSDLYQRIASGDLDVEEINVGWRELMKAACGRSWWSACRLCQSASDPDAWPIVHGRLLTSGIDLDQVSIGALCNAIFFQAMANAEDEEERNRIRFELELPPKGEQPEEVDQATNAANFMDAIAQLQQFS